MKKTAGPPGKSIPRLLMRGVEKNFGATKALAGVSLAIRPGEIHALIGENGAGKSTLMKVLSGALRADAGTMELDGAPYAPEGPLQARRRGVAMVYQELSLAPHLTVSENILLGQEPVFCGFLRQGEAKARVKRALDILGHPGLKPTDRVSSLSPGLRQLVEVARGLAFDCRVLVLDEPTSSLGQADAQRLFAVMRRLKSQGLSIVYISHFLEEVAAVADSYTVLRDGQSIGSGSMQGTSLSRVIQLMVGRKLTELFPRSRRKPGQILLEVESLTGDPKPLQAGFSLRKGEVLGIAGLVGSGRTELLRCLFGLDKVRSGKVRIGTIAGLGSPTRRLAQGMGLLSEDRKNEGLALNLPIAENITLSKLKGLGPLSLVLPSRQDQASLGWMESLSIRSQGPRQNVSQLSGGNQQKVALARLLHHDVDIWLLDEPTRGIDVGSKALIYGLINDLAAKQGKAVLMVSSYLPELLGVCDRLAVMRRGKLSAARPIAGWNARSIMKEAVVEAA